MLYMIIKSRYQKFFWWHKTDLLSTFMYLVGYKSRASHFIVTSLDYDVDNLTCDSGPRFGRNFIQIRSLLICVYHMNKYKLLTHDIMKKTCILRL